MKNKVFFGIIPLLLLASLTCSLPFRGTQPTASPSNNSSDSGAVGTVSREKSDVKHTTGNQPAVIVATSDSLFSGDGVQIVNGGIGLLDFGDSLKLRLFNDSDMNVVSATQPGIPLVASLFLTIGGFTGQLVETGGNVTFQTPNGADISVTGTAFFLGYDASLGRATAGKWVGSMQVTSAGQTISINDGYYVDIYAGQPPGEQIQNPLGFQAFEATAIQLNDPLAAVDRIRPVQTPPPATQPSVNLLGPIERGQTVQGEIGSQSSSNQYSFNADNGEIILMRAVSTGSFRPRLEVLSPDNSTICDITAEERVAQTFCALYASQFNLSVSGAGQGESGGYSLYFQSITNPGNSPPLDYNQPYEDRLSDPIAVNAYEFSGSPGDLVLIRMAFPFGEFQPGSWVYFDRFLNCSGPRRDTLVETVCELPGKGVYRLFIDDPQGVNTGSYQFVLNNLSTRRTAPVLEPGQRQVDKIGYPTQVNTYTLLGKYGDTQEVRVQLDSGDLGLEARLFRTDGQIICQAKAVDKELVMPCKLDGADEYRLVIGDYSGTHTGSYVVWLPR